MGTLQYGSLNGFDLAGSQDDIKKKSRNGFLKSNIVIKKHYGDNINRVLKKYILLI